MNNPCLFPRSGFYARIGDAIGMCGVMSAVFMAGTTAAQQYPIRPIRFIVPFPPGGATDTIARLIGQKLTEAWGMQVVIDNRSGGATIIGTDTVAKAAPDGYTILLGSFNFSVNPSLHPKLPYDTLRDFAPVNLSAYSTLVLVVHPAVPAKTVLELIALAKAKPGTLNYASSGNGSPTHLGGELLRTLAGIDIVPISYKGTIPGMTDLIAGQVQLMFPPLLAPLPQIMSGKLRALAVTSKKRTAVLPEIPTMIEAGVPGLEVIAWYGVLAPARTPRAITDKLNIEISRIVQTGDIKEKLAALGAEPATMSSDEFRKFIESEIIKWTKIVKQSGARPE
jgi:tripartite-type tricarboxylate transporter receptor subunit TctC